MRGAAASAIRHDVQFQKLNLAMKAGNGFRTQSLIFNKKLECVS
jgi:hypothetical protein